MKIAIIGSGISGISAAFNLSTNFEISIFEKNNYVGGHSNTIQAIDDENNPIPIDSYRTSHRYHGFLYTYTSL